ncbi:reverse transcriptase family protein [Mitsuaria sp. GD03876]|uniref:reverse transcriptase family protein n=1 Tax=Mitsuaria sp. GD03876 TaxID=2975399 RepID=UPI00244B0132|nr:reverse transcriptase family protein [Mitsuaria sp. GD03876]MDH0864137.1 reverse transcriptase family protein [Mitsuaria sp. GD03876]
MPLAAPLTYARWIALALARALQADDHRPRAREAESLQARAEQCLGLEARPWLKPLCVELARMPEPVWRAHSVASLATMLEDTTAFFDGFDPERFPRPAVHRLLLRPSRMRPRPFAIEHLALPAWPTEADLAAWLGLSLDDLDLFAGPAQRFREAIPTALRPRAEATRHYRCLLIPKRRGGLRLIEAPMRRLRALQRRLLDGLLNALPCHEAAHGFVPGRNVASHAAMHVGQDVVIRFDLRDFFPSVGAARVAAIFRTLGYGDAVVARLTTLCTARTPAMVRERLREDGSIDRDGATRLASPHLPQGAPTSPALANLSLFSMDLRLAGLAGRFGASYSRYADDLVISGPATLRRDQDRLRAWVAAIVEDEGFRLRRDKTRAMPAGGRQQVTGVVVNEKPNLPREDYDRLKAELHRLGAMASVDAALRAPLLGRLAWAGQFLAPSRMEKLRRQFDAIRFDDRGAQGDRGDRPGPGDPPVGDDRDAASSSGSLDA